MFKKTLFAVLLLSMIAGCSKTDDVEDMSESESEKISYNTECDEQYNECAEKCGDPASEICIQQCEEASEDCYELVRPESEEDSSDEDEETVSSKAE